MAEDRPGRPADPPPSPHGRLVRWRGAAGLALRRLRGGSAGGSRQLALAVAGVALAVALVVVVTGVSVGLATETTVRSTAVDYWIVPEAGTASTAVVSVSGPQLGGVHAAGERVRAIDGVTGATPVLLELVRVRSPGGEPQYVLAIGVVPTGPSQTIAGLSVGTLTPGDPHYAGGGYDGPWTGEAVLSTAAADRLGVGSGSRLAVNATNASAAADRSFRVAAVADGDAGTEPLAQLPIAVVHLSELQAVTGASEGDLADQLLVETDRPGVRPELAAVYPRSTVVSSRSLAARSVLEEDLPLAIAGAAALVALVVGTLVVATTLGLAGVADRRLRAVLAAVGVSGGTRRLLVATRTLAVAVAGGLAGVFLGVLAAAALNALARRAIDAPGVVRLDPLVVATGVGVALGIAVLVTPYLLWLEGRTAPLEVLAGR